jgi:hypothetical protein
MKAMFNLLLVVTLATLPHALPAAQDSDNASADTQAATIEVLRSGIDLAVPLTADTLLVTDEDGQLLSMAVPGGALSYWECSWDAAEAGWAEPGPVRLLTASNDGRYVCFLQLVALPDDYELQYEGMRYAMAAVLARADGTDAQCVALSIEVGGGPEFAFSTDGSRLFGTPMLQCEATPQAYADFINNGTATPPEDNFNYIETATGKRGLLPGLDIGDGFWKCPYSDSYRIENNWYAHHDFASFATGGKLGSYSVPDEQSSTVYSWVLPDALFISYGATYGLVYTDGSFRQAPRNGLNVHCWLPDGSYLISHLKGDRVRHARIDWDGWHIGAAETLAGVSFKGWETVTPLPDSSGVIINEYGHSELKHLPLAPLEKQEKQDGQP